MPSRAIAELRKCKTDAENNYLEAQPKGEDLQIWKGFLQGIDHAILHLEMNHPNPNTIPKK